MLDTHVFLWMVSTKDKLPEKVKNILEDGDNLLFLSSISGLEIAIKYKIGKLKLPEKPFKYINKLMVKYNIVELPLRIQHTAFTADHRYS